MEAKNLQTPITPEHQSEDQSIPPALNPPKAPIIIAIILFITITVLFFILCSSTARESQQQSTTNPNQSETILETPPQPEKPSITPIDIKQAFIEIESMLKERNYDVAFAYYNLDKGYTYLFDENTEFYAASLAKVVCALYILENMNLTPDIENELAKMITYSNNESYDTLINIAGINNIKQYANNTLMLNNYLPNPVETYYGNTTANEQLKIWKYLYNFINTNEKGHLLKSYATNSYYNDFIFEDKTNFMHKYGLLGSYYHNSGISLDAESPYIIIVLTTGYYTPENSSFINQLSQKTFLINQQLTSK